MRARGQIRAGLAAIAIAALLAAGAGAPAASGDGGAKGKVKLRRVTPTAASGKVRSKARQCRGGREVTLFRQDDFISVKLSSTTSNGRGRWKVKQDLQPGRYFAKLEAAPGCRYAVSRYKRLR